MTIPSRFVCARRRRLGDSGRDGGLGAGRAREPEGLLRYRQLDDRGRRGGDLDQAARLFRDGNPFVMIVAGVADTVGSPDRNLQLSLDRAEAVAQGLTGARHPSGAAAGSRPRQQRARGRYGRRHRRAREPDRRDHLAVILRAALAAALVAAALALPAAAHRRRRRDPAPRPSPGRISSPRPSAGAPRRPRDRPRRSSASASSTTSGSACPATPPRRSAGTSKPRKRACRRRSSTSASCSTPGPGCRAIRWWARSGTRAAANGHPRGEYDLGLLYERGEGVPATRISPVTGSAAPPPACPPPRSGWRRSHPPRRPNGGSPPPSRRRRRSYRRRCRSRRAGLVGGARPAGRTLSRGARAASDRRGAIRHARHLGGDRGLRGRGTAARHARALCLARQPGRLAEARYAASRWQPVGAGADGDARAGIPEGRVTLRAGADDRPALWLAEELAQSFHEAGLWVRIADRRAGAAGERRALRLHRRRRPRRHHRRVPAGAARQRRGTRPRTRARAGRGRGAAGRRPGAEPEP